MFLRTVKLMDSRIIARHQTLEIASKLRTLYKFVFLQVLILFFHYSYVTVMYNKKSKQSSLFFNPPEFLVPVIGTNKVFMSDLFRCASYR